MRAHQVKLATDISLESLAEHSHSRLESLFNQYLHDIPSPELKTAMEYTLSNRGKGIRPLLVYATGAVFDAAWENLDLAASAVELIHTYSLIHDDLPCMDDADLRRGKPACHKVYGEGMGVLTGDALQSFALQLMASHPAPISQERRLKMIASVSQAIGPFGIAAGQALDIILLPDKSVSCDLLEEIYRLKTARLISTCVVLGWLASEDDAESNRAILSEFGERLGLAFQIQDDILDMEAETAILGKPSGIDFKNNKITYPRLMGLNHAKEKVQSLYEAALENINYLGYKAQPLRELMKQLLERKH